MNNNQDKDKKPLSRVELYDTPKPGDKKRKRKFSIFDNLKREEKNNARPRPSKKNKPYHPGQKHGNHRTFKVLLGIRSTRTMTMPPLFRPAPVQRRSGTAVISITRSTAPPAIVMTTLTPATLILTVRQAAPRLVSQPAGNQLLLITTSGRIITASQRKAAASSR